MNQLSSERLSRVIEARFPYRMDCVDESREASGLQERLDRVRTFVSRAMPQVPAVFDDSGVAFAMQYRSVPYRGRIQVDREQKPSGMPGKYDVTGAITVSWELAKPVNLERDPNHPEVNRNYRRTQRRAQYRLLGSASRFYRSLDPELF